MLTRAVASQQVSARLHHSYLQAGHVREPGDVHIKREGEEGDREDGERERGEIEREDGRRDG